MRGLDYEAPRSGANQRVEPTGMSFIVTRSRRCAGVQTGEHLARCLVYIDLNMVRAAVVEHPAQWEIGGYHEIQRERARYRIVDRTALAEALEIDVSRLAAAHTEWIEEALRGHRQEREALWTESVAVGGRPFVETLQRQLGDRGHYRAIDELEGVHVLREAPEACGRHLQGEIESIGSNPT